MSGGRAVVILRAPSGFATLAVVALLALGEMASPPAAWAQSKVFRVGYLGTTPPTPATSHIPDAMMQALREGGYHEGRNLVVERRYSEGRAERFGSPSTSSSRPARRPRARRSRRRAPFRS